jgi:acyl carrier protein
VTRAEEVRAAVADHLGIDAALLTEQASLSRDLGLDSLAGIEMATALEDRFSMRITDDELAALRTYGDLERLVLRKVVA